MKVALLNTDRIVELDTHGSVIPARVWEGQTDTGIPVIAFITRIAVKRDRDTAQFEAELLEVSPPTADVVAWPSRMLID